MNKKILAKTLLPIATVALLGGGIASSLVLTSCSKKSDGGIIYEGTFNSEDEIINFINNHSQNLNYTIPEPVGRDYSKYGDLNSFNEGDKVNRIVLSTSSFTNANQYEIIFGTDSDQVALVASTDMS
jgi:hypothetical protein